MLAIYPNFIAPRFRDTIEIFISCNKPKKKISKFDLILEVGPELVAGSTRLKSGTITKNVLNIITTTAMIKAEKVFKNMMVNISPSTNKLRARAVRNISTILNLEKPASLKLLESSNWNMKLAIIMFKKNISYSKARNLSSNLSFKELFKK